MKYLLKLYVVSQTPNAIRALENLKRICESELEGQYEIRVIDVIKEPGAAEEDGVVATPTLVKELPAPVRRVIGDLSDREGVLSVLNLGPSSGCAPPTPDLLTAGSESA